MLLEGAQGRLSGGFAPPSSEFNRLNLVINGKGTVWIDDIVLSREPRP